MSKTVISVGDTFGLLTAVEPSPLAKGANTWKFSCSCGVLKDIQARRVSSGDTKSCGCLQGKAAAARLTTHGMTTDSASPLEKKAHRCWKSIVERCYSLTHPAYSDYGGRGIGIQGTWRNDAHAFYVYVSQLDNFDLDHSLDRVDNSLGYFEGNLRWATKGEQCRNQRMSDNNTSGKTGVTWHINSCGNTRAVAVCRSGGKIHSGTFSVKNYGLLPAFAMACQYRDKMIAQLNAAGAGYTENHGK